MSSGFSTWILCPMPEMVDVFEAELELELGQLSEAANMLGGAKGDIHPEAGMVMLCSVMGVAYPLRLADASFSTLEVLLLWLRVRGRPARLAGL